MENANLNMQSLAKACENLNLEYKKLDQLGNLVAVDINGQPSYFVISRIPFANESISGICLYKAYTYWVFKDDLPMPFTKSYLDPNAEDERISNNAEFKKQKLIVEDIVKSFEFPLIVKMNSGSKGKHVYKCKDKRSVAKAVKSIFKKNQANYDTSILAQKFIEIKNEYRAIAFEGEVILLYEKVFDAKNTSQSPLHNEEGKAVLIKDESIQNEIVKLIEKSPVMKQFDWLGLDIAMDSNGDWWVLELNTRPGFNYFIRDNGDEEIVKMYEKILLRIKDGKK